MHIGIIGINHKSAELRLREKLALACERLFGPTHTYYPHFTFVLLSTCNRTEIYFHGEDLAHTHTFLLNAMRERMDEEFEHCIYSYFGSDCFFHLARVTAGIDSALIGETEIQGQVKRAYTLASSYHRLAPELHFLFQKCLKIGKNVRSIYSLSYDFPSLEEAIFNAGTKLFEQILDKKILFVGLSNINLKILSDFKKRGCRNLYVCNRSQEKAAYLASQEGFMLHPWNNLSDWPAFDIAIFGTKCPTFLAEKEDLLGHFSCKLVIDLSVPRNVDPKVGRQAQITLLNVDQLNKTIDRRQTLKAQLVARIENGTIAAAVTKQIALFKLKERAPRHLFSPLEEYA